MGSVLPGFQLSDSSEQIRAGTRRTEGKNPITPEPEIHNLLDGHPFLAFQKIPILNSAMKAHGNSRWM